MSPLTHESAPHAVRNAGRRWWRLLVTTGTAAVVFGVALAARGAGGSAASRTAGPGVRAGTAVRVGKLLYRVERTRRAATIEHDAIERAPADAVFVSVTLTRANATQTYAPIAEGGIRLAAGGERFPAYRVVNVRCDRGDCEVLDPGESRTDTLVFVAPEAIAGGIGLEVQAASDEPGPRVRALDLE